MKLVSVELHDFKSIRSSNRFETGDVTCLVGKNESGKTAVLQALYKLNPVVAEDSTYDVTDEYPRAEVEEYRQKIEEKEIDPVFVVRAEYALEEDDVSEIEADFGTGVAPTRSVTLSKGYANRLLVGLKVDEAKGVVGLVTAAGLPGDVAAEALKCKDMKGLASFLEADRAKREKSHAKAVAEAEAIADADAKTRALHEAGILAESNAAKELRGQLAEVNKNGLNIYLWSKYLQSRWPKFLYFDEYYQMAGHLNVEQLRDRQSRNALLHSDRPMLGLIDLARLNLDELLNTQRTEELVSRLEGASNHLSRQILKYWSQNQHLHVRFDVRPGRPGDPPDMRSGTNLWGRVHDSIHSVTTPLASRSRGFLWFFSFLAWFSQQKKLSHPLILLLDEPGLFLHAKAQGDLLRYVEEELSPHHQVIYSTHSPFMVDAHHFDRVRIVEDKSIERALGTGDGQVGTKVFSDVLEAGEGSLFPLQGALGYDIAQTLFVGPNCLIVEGVSDLLYFQAMSALLEEQGRPTLDQRWTITPVGGADKVPTFAALLGTQNALTVAALIDLQQKDRQSIENLYRRKLLAKSHVLTFADFTATEEADIEDMFDTSFYLTLVNKAYENNLAKKIAVKDVRQGPPRILVRLQAHLEKSPLSRGTRFNHFRPAREFAENLATWKTKVAPETLQRFEDAFTRLNALLPK